MTDWIKSLIDVGRVIFVDPSQGSLPCNLPTVSPDYVRTYSEGFAAFQEGKDLSASPYWRDDQVKFDGWYDGMVDASQVDKKGGT